MSILLYLLTTLTRAFIFILNVFGSSGTALPGIWVEKFYPSVLAKYAAFYSQIILITGTNGKTTTQLLIRHVLSRAGHEVVSNTSGSNMFRGIATAILSAGLPKTKSATLLLEVEEGTMPKIAPYISPNKVVITNFFRDQLDAYGELSKTVWYVRNAIRRCPLAKIYANADDKTVFEAIKGLDNNTSSFSMGTFARDFLYEKGTKANIGPSADIICTSYKVDNKFVTEGEVWLEQQKTTTHFSSPLAGQYNIYNLMAALLVCLDMGIKPDKFLKYASSIKSPFGRGEEVMVSSDGGDAIFRIFLVKNPAGMTQVWNMVKGSLKDKSCLIALNDNVADGKDVSWIWDAKIESSLNSNKPLLFTGTRAYDMAIRFKYAGFEVEESQINKDIGGCINGLIKRSKQDKECVVLATYTAMNKIREVLAKSAKIEKFG